MLVFTLCVLVYAITMQDSSIYEMVSGAYQVPLVSLLHTGLRPVLETRHHPGGGGRCGPGPGRVAAP